MFYLKHGQTYLQNWKSLGIRLFPHYDGDVRPEAGAPEGCALYLLTCDLSDLRKYCASQCAAT